ncbi:hypothetical protein A6R71_15815 [Xanthomonas translucens pv. arrhenatheri]|nr:hypothetical protein A6R71_15815 [Xanthomonas translucens pv. arrhenatheri]
MCELVGAGIQVGIAEHEVLVHHGDGVGRLRDLLFKQAVQAGIVGEHAPRLRQPLQPLLALGRAQQRQSIDAGAVVGDHAAQQRDELGQVAFDGAALEQRDGVSELAGDASAGIAQRQFQVELRAVMVGAETFQLQSGQGQRLRRTLLPTQQHLEQRMAGKVADRIERFDELLERQVLVSLRSSRESTHLGEQHGDGGIAGKIDVQRLGIGEKPDHRLELDAMAIGHWAADHHAALAGLPRQQDGPTRQQGHEHRHAMALAQRGECAAEVGIEHDLRDIAGVILHRRAWAIAGQAEQGRCLAKMRKPEIKLPLQSGTLGLAPLPGHDIGVLQGQRRERIVQPLRQGGVQRAQFADQQLHRPAIGDDVVHGQQQHVIVCGQTQQTAADQRTLRQVEWAGGLLQCMPMCLGLGLLRSVPGEIDVGQCEAAAGRIDELFGSAVHRHDAGAQGRVPGDDPFQRALQRQHLQRAAQAHPGRDQISRRAAWIQLCKQPQALLGERQRYRPIRVAPRDAVAVRIGRIGVLQQIPQALDFIGAQRGQVGGQCGGRWHGRSGSGFGSGE